MTGRRISGTSAAVLTATFACSFGVRVAVRADQEAAPAPGQTAGQHYKNVQVLKDVPADRFILTMQYIAASLGVQCNFCHVQGANEKDDKETKKTARKMMQMVNTINDAQFDGRSVLSCASCHNGHSKPQRTPPLASEMTPDEAARVRAMRGQARGGFQGGPGRGEAPGRGEGAGRGGRGAFPEPPPPQKPTETVDQVVDKYIQALGGRDALQKANTRVMMGTVTTRDLQSSPVTVQETSKGQYRIEIASQPNPTIRAFDGKAGWTIGGFNNQVRDLEGFQLEQGTRLSDLTLPLQLQRRYEGLAVKRYAEIDGKGAIVLAGHPYPDVAEELFFDRDTGLLLRRVVATRTGLGELPEQIDYSDYRDVSGVKVPFTVRHATWNAVTTEKFADVKLNVAVAETQFAKPPIQQQ